MNQLKFAPLPVPVDGGLAVPMDISRIAARLRFDPLTRDTLDATLTFTAGIADGFPVFDLRQPIHEAWLDDVPLPIDCLAPQDLGGGAGTEMRVIRRSLRAGTSHTLRLFSVLGPPQVRLDRNRLPILHWNDGSRLTFRFGFTDTRPGRYLESWVPSNLIFDEFELLLDVEIAQTIRSHCLITTGISEQRAFNCWTVRFPAMTIAFSPLLEILSADRAESRTARVSLPMSGQSIRVEAWKEIGDPTNLENAIKSIEQLLPKFEALIGPYVHGDRFVYFADAQSGGMEYAGGVTGDIDSLNHETCHSWWGRGVRPASQVDAWFDEGVTKWTADFESSPREILIDTTSPPTELRLHLPWARAMSPASHRVGLQVFAALAGLIGAVRLQSLLRDLFALQYGTPLATIALEEFIVRQSPNQRVVDIFHRHVFGLPNHQECPQLTFVRPDKSPLEAPWDHPALRVRQENDEGEEHQWPLINHENWIYARIRNDGSKPVTHCVIVFRADPKPIFDPSGPSVASLAAAALVQEDWPPGEERLLAVPWKPLNVLPETFALSAQVLANGLLEARGNDVVEFENFAWKSGIQRLTGPGEDLFISISIGNRFADNHRRLRLELIRPAERETVEATMSHPRGLPVIDDKVSPSYACTSRESSRSHRQAGNDPNQPQDPPTVVPFAPGSRAAITLDLPATTILLPTLTIRIPDDVVSGQALRFNLVARCPEDDVILGGLVVSITIL